MKEQSFSLIPFPTPNTPSITIAGKISLKNNILALQYWLTGNLEDIYFPPTSPNPSRKDELWKSTCFEFFLVIKDHPEYWEFNLSPSGDWNVYHMDAYRRVGFREEIWIQHLHIETDKKADTFTLNATVDLEPITQVSEYLNVGITAIIQTIDSNQSYWALLHPAPEPDFHVRESFILALDGQTHFLGQAAADD